MPSRDSFNPVERDGEKVTRTLPAQAEKRNWEGIKFPTPCDARQFKKFEKNSNVSLLVFEHEVLNNKTNIIPLYIPKERYEKTVRIFFFIRMRKEKVTIMSLKI